MELELDALQCAEVAEGDDHVLAAICHQQHVLPIGQGVNIDALVAILAGDALAAISIDLVLESFRNREYRLLGHVLYPFLLSTGTCLLLFSHGESS